MDEAKAREVLGFKEGQEFSWGDIKYYVCPEKDDFCIDGNYTIEELEAILWFAKNKQKD